MLVLSRKTGEKIRIGDNVTVTIVRIGPNNVRLGIDAPRDLNIVREELCSNEPVLNQPQSTSDGAIRP
jgi:carbon storage regulator